jgi:hypothetical protein
MAENWKEVEAQKDYQCHCCGGLIQKGENDGERERQN